jgi:RNA polymerase sigma-70 factor (ECF subfamily)
MVAIAIAKPQVLGSAPSGGAGPAVKQELVTYIPSLRAFAVSLCGDADRADDLVQDTLVKAWISIEQFQEGTNLRAWLFTILRNTYFSQLRKTRREVEDADGEKVARLAVLPGQHGHIDLDDFRRALDTLPADQREALVLVGAAGFSYAEAADICGCAVGTIKSRIYRARARLAQLLRVGSCDDFCAEPMFEAVVVAGGRNVNG